MSTKAESMDAPIRVILFSGKKSDWPAWEEKFLAKAARKGFVELYLGENTVEIPKAKETLDKEKDKEKIEIKKLNELAYGELITSMDTSTTYGNVAFNLVKSSKTGEYPKGNATNAWKRLKDKYAPENAPTLTKLHKIFYSSTLTAGQDPDIWITKLEDLRIRMEQINFTMSDDMLMIHVINNLPEEYENLVESLGRRIDITGKSNDALTIEEMRFELSLKYERMNTRKYEARGGKQKGEHALYAGAQFKGKCNFCGKYGHRLKDCWEKDPSKKNKETNNSNNSRQTNTNTNTNTNSNSNSNNNRSSSSSFKGKCRYCQIMGHKESECRKKQREQRDTAATTTDDTNEDQVDMVCTAIEDEVNMNNEMNQATLTLFSTPNIGKCEY